MARVTNGFEGLIAGACGTIAMGGFAFLSRRIVEPEKPTGKSHYESVVDWGMSSLSKEPLDVPSRIRAGEMAHLGFGALWGIVFALVNGDRPIEPVSKGTVWGTALWAAAFTGYMPALGISKSLRQMGNYERLRTLGSHLTFGIFTWTFLKAFSTAD